MHDYVRGVQVKDDIYQEFATQTQANLPSRGNLYGAAPKVRNAFQGIKPHTSSDDFVLTAYREVKEAHANETTPIQMVVPQVRLAQGSHERLHRSQERDACALFSRWRVKVCVCAAGARR